MLQVVSDNGVNYSFTWYIY